MEVEYSRRYAVGLNHQATPELFEMKSLWKVLFPVIVLATVAFVTFEGYQLWGIPGAVCGAVLGLLAGYGGLKTFDIRR